MEAKDEHIIEYRERIHLVPTDVTAFSKLSNAELKAKVLDVVEKVRESLRKSEERSRDLLFSGWRRNISEMNEKERKKAWKQETQALMRDSFQTNADYEA